MTVVRRRILEHVVPGKPLGRNVHHDSRSRRYAFNTAGITLTSVRHARHVLAFDQGQIGSCTGQAGEGALATDPFFATLPNETFDEAAAVALYSAATKLDDAPGSYPPDDTGSSGLAVAQALKAQGKVSGYQHTFTLADALKALVVTPVITGINWYSSMDEPSSSGLVAITSDAYVRGGHELALDEIDATNSLVWFTNSWGTSWGVDGRASMSFSTFGRLLDEQGDVTVFTPITSPAPTPTPVPGADDVLAARSRTWLKSWQASLSPTYARAVKKWLSDTGR